MPEYIVRGWAEVIETLDVELPPEFSLPFTDAYLEYFYGPLEQGDPPRPAYLFEDLAKELELNLSDYQDEAGFDTAKFYLACVDALQRRSARGWKRGSERFEMEVREESSFTGQAQSLEAFLSPSRDPFRIFSPGSGN